MNKPSDFKAYAKSFPKEVQDLLEKLRATIKKAAPGAEEVISYGMPAFKFQAILVWFAAYTKHIGFYPKAAAIEAFANDLSGYKFSKGAIQFPLDKPLPLRLVTRIIKFRIAEDQIL